jgi:hypothetical protein
VTAVRVLSSVAHNFAHHAASSMSWLHPHAYRAAQAASVGELDFDLMAPFPLPLPSVEPPLRLACEGLRSKFVEILEKDGFALSQLRSARLTMRFSTSDEYYCVTTCRLETLDGKAFEKSSTSAG